MAEKNKPATGLEEPVLLIHRTFDAPRKLVYEAWTDPKHLSRWQGAPIGFTITSHKIDFRPGGEFRLCMRSPEGVDHWLHGVYREIVDSQRLVFTHTWLDAGGKPGAETLVTITFADLAGKTELTLRQTGFKSAQSRDGHGQGWNSMLDRLAGYLNELKAPSANAPAHAADEFTISRLFDAPPALVFKAWTDPKQMARWWGPSLFTNPVCDMDVRSGGAYRIVMRAPDGREFPMKGVFREVVAPKLLVMTMDCSEHPAHWHDMVKPNRTKDETNPAGILLTTVTFDDEAGKTRLTVRTRFQSAAIRDAMVKMDMNDGWSSSLVRLGELLAHAPAGD